MAGMAHQYFSTKTDRSNGSFYVAETCSASSSHLPTLKYNIFKQKCIVVTSLLCYVTTTRFLSDTTITSAKFSGINLKLEWPNG